MDERKEPGDPMFDWLPIDQIFMYFDPDKDWERMWASNREFGNVLKDAVRELEAFQGPRPEIHQTGSPSTFVQFS